MFAFATPVTSLQYKSSVVGTCRVRHAAIKVTSHRVARCDRRTAQIRAVQHTGALLSAPMTLELADNTRVSFRFSLDAATTLGTEINQLVGAFKRIAAAAAEGKRSIEKSLEYRHADETLEIEIECNPNIFPNAFNAMVYVKIDDGTVKLTSQAALTKLVDNVKSYKAAMSA